MFVFTCQPEDYTNRGSIVTPLKDRIESQILTHYPRNIETSLSHYGQEADIHGTVAARAHQRPGEKADRTGFLEARDGELVDKKSGVSARLTISAFENAISAAERVPSCTTCPKRRYGSVTTMGIIPRSPERSNWCTKESRKDRTRWPFTCWKKALRTIFAQYFPNPDSLKKKRQKEQAQEDNPYKSVTVGSIR